MSAPQYFIAQTVQDNQYVVLQGDMVVAGSFSAIGKAVRAREALVKAEAVVK